MNEAQLTAWIDALTTTLQNVAGDGAQRVEIDGMEVLRASPEALQQMLNNAYNQLDMLRRAEADKNPFVRSAPVTH